MTSTSGNTPGPSTGRLHAAFAHAERLWRHAEQYVHSHLVWSNIYRATSYLRSSLWIIPILSIVLVLTIAPTLHMLDLWLAWRLAGLGVAGAQALYQTVITLTLSFIVFTFGSLLVAIQVASGQLTPRIIATTLLRDNVVRYSVGLFVFTLIFSVMALDRLETKVHELVALVAAMSGHRLYGDLPVPDRLRGTAAASGQHRRARWRGRGGGDQVGLSENVGRR